MQKRTINNKTSGSGTLLWWIVGAVIVIVGFVVLGRFGSTPQTIKKDINPSDLVDIQTSNAPWPVEFTHLAQRLQSEGLPQLASEGTVLHIHQHIDIYIHGQHEDIPANIGIDQQSRFIAPIHVHDTTGVIHVESPTVQTYTLGQFFDIWGVRFTANCIGSYCTQGANNLKIYSNGELYTGDPRQLDLSAHQEITVVYGSDKEIPATIPSSYQFPQGE